MNFFKQQQIAKSRSTKLILLFLLSIICIVLITNFIIILILYGFNHNNLINPTTYLISTACVLTVILIGSIAKAIELKRGGKAVAQMLGGIPLLPQYANHQEKILLNVVEEISIASGVIVPPVFILPDLAINAFAAGHTMSDAVIGVTTGAVNNLSRDELQGVIAHEFSHIFHGDMALNMNMTKLISGIDAISALGHFLIRPARSRRAHGGRVDGKQYLLGVALIGIGSIGVFFGSIIRAAISRQREYLADASAVRYTRNNLGLAGALKKIGGSLQGSVLQSSHAKEFSHSLFSDGVTQLTKKYFASHPPLDSRIIQLEPDWNGRYIFTSADHVSAQTTSAFIATRAGGVRSLADSSQDKSIPIEFTSALSTPVTSAIVTPVTPKYSQSSQPFISAADSEFELARHFIDAIPKVLNDAAHDELNARALVYAFLFHANEHQAQQARLILTMENEAILQTAQTLFQTLKKLQPQSRLPLIELCIPALHRQSKQQLARMSALMSALILVDGKLDLFEWVLNSLVLSSLHPTRSHGKLTREGLLAVRPKKIKQVRAHLSVLFSAIIHHFGQGNHDQLLSSAQEELAGVLLTLVPAERVSVELLDHCIQHINCIHLLEKPRIIKATLRIINASHTPDPKALEFIKALGAVINCPIPMFESHSFLGSKNSEYKAV